MGKLGKEILLAVLVFAFIGTASAGWVGGLVGATVGALISWSSSTDAARKEAGSRAALQSSADEARADELRLVTNHLHASGIPSWRDAARELSELKHRDVEGPWGYGEP